jgi:putative membrane protein (TIGR04086 family)
MTDPTARPGPEPALDRLSLGRAVAYGQLLAIPAALANVALAEQEPPPKGALNLTLLVLLAAFAIAGVAAGRNARRDAARMGAIAGALAFVPAQLIGVMGRLDRGDGLSIASIVVVGLLAACAGTVGGQLGARRRATVEGRTGGASPTSPPTSSDPDRHGPPDPFDPPASREAT